MTELLSEIRDFMKRQNKLITNLGSKVEDSSVQYTCIREKVRQQLEKDKKHDEMERIQMIEKYGVTLKVKCEYCKKEFSNLSKLNKHVKTHRKKILYKCKRCRRLFPTIEILKAHILSHVEDKTLVNGIQQWWSSSMEERKPDMDPIQESKKNPIKEIATNIVEEKLTPNEGKLIDPVVITPIKASFATSVIQQDLSDLKPDSDTKLNIDKDGNDTQLIDGEILLTLCSTSQNQDNEEVVLKKTTQEELSSDNKIIEIAKTVKTWRCKICRRAYSKQSHLNRHNALKHKGWKYNCKYKSCMKKFKSQRQLDLHNKRHTEITDKQASPTSCMICQNIFTNKIELQNHMDVVHKKYVCLNRKCNLEFSDAVKLKEHMSVHKSKTPLHCKLCTKSFEECKKLKLHIADVHYIGSMHSCDYLNCSKVFGNEVALSEHMSIQHGLNRQPFKCEICKKSFKTKRRFEYHQESHKRVDSGLFTCNTCSKTYLNLNQLLIHKKMSH